MDTDIDGYPTVCVVCGKRIVKRAVASSQHHFDHATGTATSWHSACAPTYTWRLVAADGTPTSIVISGKGRDAELVDFLRRAGEQRGLRLEVVEKPVSPPTPPPPPPPRSRSRRQAPRTFLR